MNSHSTIPENQDALILRVSPTISKAVFFSCVLLCLTPFVSPPLALLFGLFVAQCTGHPYLQLNGKATSILLQYAVVCLGFGMNVHSALQAGKAGILFTVCSILATLILGYFLGKFMRVPKKTAFLISSGTAICGGSAIAAISPVIKADESEISVSLGCVFILNSVALFLFPYFGHIFGLSATQFGLWCAIAIHDTSSVVGAASKFGPKALEVATTVKLARALWIVPVSFGSALIFKNTSRQIKIPYFILFFILAMIANTYLPFMKNFSPYLTAVAKAGLTLTLFLIGAGLSRKMMVQVGFRPLLQGVLLCLFISAVALFAVIHLAG